MRHNILSTALLGVLAAAIPSVAADRNLLIVSIGDSLAAGEGNPNSFSITGGAVWSNTPCHRSVNNGRRVAANRIGSMDGFSTSFHDFACSGATIDNLWSTKQHITQPDAAPNTPDNPIQLDSVVAAFGAVPGTNRTDAVIDILMISIGINDANFADVVQKCLTDAFDCTTSPQVAIARGSIAVLSVKYANLANAIRTRLPHVQHVYITQYPGEITSKPDDFCGDLDDGSGDPSMSLVNATESQFLGDEILTKLNDQVQMAASANGWLPVRGPEDTFTTHGYCTPLQRRYVNTALDSLTRQGNGNGTMHPNIAGHKAYADALIVRATVDFGLPLETPRIVRHEEFNVAHPCDLNPLNLPNCVALPFLRKVEQVEIAQHPGTITVTLQHRVLDDPFCVPFIGCTTPAVPAFLNTAMTDVGNGRLNLFSASIPGSENLGPGQTLQYRYVITATRAGQTTGVTTSTESIRLGDPLEGTFLLP